VCRTQNVIHHLQVAGAGPTLADIPVERDDSRSLLVGIKSPENPMGFVSHVFVVRLSLSG